MNTATADIRLREQVSVFDFTYNSHAKYLDPLKAHYLRNSLKLGIGETPTGALNSRCGK